MQPHQDCTHLCMEEKEKPVVQLDQLGSQTHPAPLYHQYHLDCKSKFIQSHKTWSMLNTGVASIACLVSSRANYFHLFCLIPYVCALIALIFSFKVRKHMQLGNRVIAAAKSKKAFLFNLAATIGLLLNVLLNFAYDFYAHMLAIRLQKSQFNNT